MDLSKLPTPISYAIAFLIIVLGSATAFRIYQGSGIEIETPIGDISIPTGDQDIPLRSFVEESQKALALADEKIVQQGKTIDGLERRLNSARAEVDKLNRLSERLAQADSTAAKTRATQALASATQIAKTQIAPLATVAVSKNTQVEKTLKKQIDILNKVDWSSKVKFKK